MGKVRSSLTSNRAHHSDPTSCQPGSVLSCLDVPKVRDPERAVGAASPSLSPPTFPPLLICPRRRAQSKVNKSSPWSIPELQPILPRPRKQPPGHGPPVAGHGLRNQPHGHGPPVEGHGLPAYRVVSRPGANRRVKSLQIWACISLSHLRILQQEFTA